MSILVQPPGFTTLASLEAVARNVPGVFLEADSRQLLDMPVAELF
jgi:hypothetical protein